MTSDHDEHSEQQAQSESLHQVIYRAVGWVAGIYQPSPEKFYQGMFVTNDGLTIPAQLTGRFQSRLKREHPDYASVAGFFNKAAQWTVYPKTNPLEFDLTQMKPLKSDPVDGLVRLDHFRVVGFIESASDDVVAVPHPTKSSAVEARAATPRDYAVHIEA